MTASTSQLEGGAGRRVHRHDCRDRVPARAGRTYLASLVEGLTAEFKYSIVAGAVTGGGLTVIANAPNRAGFAIRRRHFDDDAIRPLGPLAAHRCPRWWRCSRFACCERALELADTPTIP